MDVFNGVVYFRSESDVHVHVDACREAAGAFHAGDWLYCSFKADYPRVADMHINYKEVCAVVASVDRWAHTWRNRDVVIHTDSTVAKAVINKGRSKDPYINALLRAMSWKCVKYYFALRAIHVPGAINLLPDTISRLHEPGNLDTLSVLLQNWFHGRYRPSPVSLHMSAGTHHQLLCAQVARWLRNSGK